jgi:hypothetical protein
VRGDTPVMSRLRMFWGAVGTARLLAAVGRARHVTDRNRHRPRNTKARQAFEKAHRNTPTWIAEAVLDICGQAA